MSQKYYINKWDTAQEDLNNIIICERPPKPDPLPKSLKEAFDRICWRYVQYIRIYKRLNKCYDFMVHPQKRNLIARCMEGVTGRIVELRHELFRCSVSEYAKFGPFCVACKILPSEFEMELSHTFQYDKIKRIKHTQEQLEYILTTMGKTDDFIDAHYEHGTMYRVPYKHPPRKSKIDSRIQSRTQSDIELLEIKRKAVNWKKVQYRFKIFQCRMLLDAAREHDENFLDLRLVSAKENAVVKAEKIVVDRSIQTARENEEVYTQKLITARESIKKSKVARNMEHDMKQNICQWILECREATGSFPDYPADDIGGSAVIFALKNPEQLQEELNNVDEKSKPKPKPKSEDKKSKKADIPEGYVMMGSNFVDESLVSVAHEYDMVWRNKNEADNFKQQMSQNILDEHVRSNLETELRQQIDEQMRSELECLATAVDKQKLASAKPKKSKPEKKKAKKDKRKKLKDLTPNADLEDLYCELVRNDIVKKVRKVELKDFLGEMNLVSDEENNGQECLPDLGDVRQMLFDFVVLPMSNKNVHERAPCIKSLLLAGPSGSGKKMLVHAVCNELGANLFNLTAENIRNQYIDPEDQQMLMHLVMKVGKLMEPSIIFIDDCDLMFTKKLPPEINSNPARMKSNLIKAMKTIGPEDRIMLIGATKRPFRAAKGPLLKMYERVITIYPPTYPSRHAIWESKISEKGGNVTRSLILSVLAQLSSNFTARDIILAADAVLDATRIKRQIARALTTEEFCEALSMYVPVYREEVQALVDWMKETPLAKKREAIKELEEVGKLTFDLI